MLDDAGMIEAIAQEHPLRTSARVVASWEGQTVAEIVSAAGLEPRFGLPEVLLIRGEQITPVPLALWKRTRPKAGTRVEIGYPVNGPLAAVGAALVSAAAPAISATFFGGSLWATAAISVVAGLAVNALVPPPPQPSHDKPEDRFSITGISNAENRYGVYPKVLGRRRLFPPKSARGYTETVGKDIYFRGRFALGWGPVAISDPRIGTTPISEFDDIEIELLNVRYDYSSDVPAEMVRAWRDGTERMTLYPDDIAEDAYNVLLEHNVPVSRYTRSETESVGIDITFSRGLISFGGKGEQYSAIAEYRFRYREVGGSTWTSSTKRWTAKSREPFRVTYEIKFPDPGEYEVEVMRLNALEEDEPEPGDEATGWLTGIRSRRSGRLPSHEHIAEIAIRVRASEQLSGQLNSFNVVVQQLAPVWDGSEWSSPQPVRHPAWIYANAIRGPHLRRPVSDSRIDLAALKAWADEEPHWTCDYVVDTETRLADVLDIICAAGRAKRSLTDLRYSVIRDGAAGPVRQVFTPRNSWGFRGRMVPPRDIHALRCVVTSERLDWEQDEIIVYADGYRASNATEFETLELPGVVVTADDEDEGNVWRLARYHLAQAILRPEQFEWNADWEHMRVTRGDLVRVVHDVPVVGYGAARITSIYGTALSLDAAFDLVAGDYRLTVRTDDGEIVSTTGTAPDEPWTRAWTLAEALEGAKAGDLVAIEETTQESLDVLVTGIFPGENETARLTGVPAAPAVLEADQGAIPPYDPIITSPHNPVFGPVAPVSRMVSSDETTMDVLRDGSVRPRIGVMLDPVATQAAIGAWVQLRWRAAQPDQPWTMGDVKPVGAVLLLTGHLVDGETYRVEARSIDGLGRTRGWVALGEHMARALSAPPPDVESFTVTPVDFEARIEWTRPQNIPDLSHVEIRYSASATGTWNASIPIDSVPVPLTRTGIFAREGRYFAKWVDGGGRKSVNAASVYLSGSEINSQNAVETFTAHPGWTGTKTDAAVLDGDLQLALDGGAYPSAGTWESDQVTDLGAVYACRIQPFIEANGFSINDNVWDWANIFTVPNIFPADPDEWRVDVEVAASASDPTGGSDWKLVAGGTYIGRYFRFRVRLASLQADVTPVVTALNIVLDMPDRVEGDKDVVIPVAGLRIPFLPAYREVKSVVAQATGPGLKPEITKDRSGFDVVVRDAAGTAVETEIDWQALGYGREAV